MMKSKIFLLVAYGVFSALHAQSKTEHKVSTGELSQYRYVASQKFKGCYTATDVNGLNLDVLNLIKANKCKVHGYIREKGFLSALCSSSPFSHVLGEGEHIIAYARSEAKCWELLTGLQNLTYDPYRHDLIARRTPDDSENRNKTEEKIAKEKQNQTQIFYKGLDIYALGGYAEAPNLYEKDLRELTIALGGGANFRLYWSFTRPGTDFMGLGLLLGGRYIAHELKTDVMRDNTGVYTSMTAEHKLKHFDVFAAPGLVLGGLTSRFSLSAYYKPFFSLGKEDITIERSTGVYSTPGYKKSISNSSVSVEKIFTNAFSIEINIVGYEPVAGVFPGMNINIGFDVFTMGSMRAYMGSMGITILW